MAHDVDAIRERICTIGRWLYEQRMIVSGDGNISCRLGDGSMLVTPSGTCKGWLQPEQLVETDPRGEVRGDRGRPSSEFKMHLEIYRRRPDVRAVVHAHPPTATGFAVAGIALDQPVLPELLTTVGAVPLAPFSVPSTEDVVRAIGPLAEQANAFMMANHGVTTMGADLDEAYHRMESVEHYAKILSVAMQLGHVNTLTDDQLRRVAETACEDGTLPGWPPGGSQGGE